MSPDWHRHFSVEKRIEMFAEDIRAMVSPLILRDRFHNLVIDIRKEHNKAMVAADILHMKQQQSWYGLQERIYHFRESLPASKRFDFDQLIEQTQQDAAMHSYQFLPTFSIKKKTPMRSIDELKNEINELENVREGFDRDIELLNSKNENAQAQRDRVTAKIDGLKWMLNEDEVQHATDE